MKKSKAVRAMERVGKELKKPRPLSRNIDEAVLETEMFDIADRAQKEGMT